MPISPIVLQRRHAELGRIRLGDKQPTKNGRGRPNKLSAFRFTSPSQRYITDLAALYGGEAREWDNNGKPEWEVLTTAKSIPVIAVKGGLSQWMETWSGGGCVHRCDGERMVDGTPCENDDTTIKINGQVVRTHDVAKPTTRLSVMLPELEAIGVWRMESHGWNAAAEIPAVAELAQYVGDLVPAFLHLVERRTIKDGQTSRFVVPVLDLQIGTERLKQIAAEKSGQAAPAQITGSAPAQITAGNDRDYTDAVMEATSVDELRMLWRSAGEHDALTPALEKLITQRVGELNPQTPEAGDAPAGPPDTGQVEPPASGQTTSGDVDAAWMQLQVAAGKAGVGDSNLRALLEQEYAQPVEDLDAQQLLDFIGKVAAA